MTEAKVDVSLEVDSSSLVNIDEAAFLKGQSREEFMLAASVKKAEGILHADSNYGNNYGRESGRC